MAQVKNKGGKIMDLKLEQKVAIVTGAASGIGEKCALEFAKEKAKVIVSDINIEGAEKVANKIKHMEGEALPIKTNVAKKADANELAKKTIEEFGKIDILVNNAGANRVIAFADLDEGEWDRVFNVNIKGVFFCIKAVLPYMIKQKSGKIINISSLVGKEASAYSSHYSATKFGVRGLTQSLAKELAEYNINVNAVCPNIVLTPMWDPLLRDLSKIKNIPKEEVLNEFISSIPLRRCQSPEDIANVVLFLSSEVSKNMTGQSINVTGGALMQ